MHYDGAQWSAHLVADSMIVGSITSKESHIFFSTYSPWGKNTNVIYRLTQATLMVEDSTHRAVRKFGPWLLSRGDRMISFTNGVISTQILKDGRLNSSGWIREFSTPTSFGNAYARNENCIFATGQWNLLYHFNGIDWEQLL